MKLTGPLIKKQPRREDLADKAEARRLELLKDKKVFRPEVRQPAPDATKPQANTTSTIFPAKPQGLPSSTSSQSVQQTPVALGRYPFIRDDILRRLHFDTGRGYDLLKPLNTVSHAYDDPQKWALYLNSQYPLKNQSIKNQKYKVNMALVNTGDQGFFVLNEYVIKDRKRFFRISQTVNGYIARPVLIFKESEGKAFPQDNFTCFEVYGPKLKQKHFLIEYADFPPVYDTTPEEDLGPRQTATPVEPKPNSGPRPRRTRMVRRKKMIMESLDDTVEADGDNEADFIEEEVEIEEEIPEEVPPTPIVPEDDIENVPDQVKVVRESEYAKKVASKLKDLFRVVDAPPKPIPRSGKRYLIRSIIDAKTKRVLMRVNYSEEMPPYKMHFRAHESNHQHATIKGKDKMHLLSFSIMANQLITFNYKTRKYHIFELNDEILAYKVFSQEVIVVTRPGRVHMYRLWNPEFLSHQLTFNMPDSWPVIPEDLKVVHIWRASKTTFVLHLSLHQILVVSTEPLALPQQKTVQGFSAGSFGATLGAVKQEAGLDFKTGSAPEDAAKPAGAKQVARLVAFPRDPNNKSDSRVYHLTGESGRPIFYQLNQLIALDFTNMRLLAKGPLDRIMEKGFILRIKDGLRPEGEGGIGGASDWEKRERAEENRENKKLRSRFNNMANNKNNFQASQANQVSEPSQQHQNAGSSLNPFSKQSQTTNAEEIARSNMEKLKASGVQGNSTIRAEGEVAQSAPMVISNVPAAQQTGESAADNSDKVAALTSVILTSLERGEDDDIESVEENLEFRVEVEEELGDAAILNQLDEIDKELQAKKSQGKRKASLRKSSGKKEKPLVLESGQITVEESSPAEPRKILELNALIKNMN